MAADDSPSSLSPEALKARYEDVYRKCDRIELEPERFDRGIERGDDGAWGVGALVVDGSRVLFVREGDTWFLPGGRLEPDEAPEEGAKREVREETGISVDVIDLVAIAEQTFVRRKTERTYEFYFATFLAEPVASIPDASRPVPGDGVDEAEWRESVPPNTFDEGLVRRLFDEYV